jgi:hypothetical protein
MVDSNKNVFEYNMLSPKYKATSSAAENRRKLKIGSRAGQLLDSNKFNQEEFGSIKLEVVNKSRPVT